MVNLSFRQNANDTTMRYEIFNAVPLSKNKHQVVLTSSIRPTNPVSLKDYYDGIIDDFTVNYQCVLLNVDEVRLSPFRESALIFITVSTKKNKLEKAYKQKNFLGGKSLNF
jgi:hypothetical protein